MDARVKPAHDELVKQLKLAPMGSSPRVTRVGERALNEHDGIMLPLIGQSAALVGRRRAGADPAESSTRSWWNGRHNGLRSRRRKTWEFKSLRAHQLPLWRNGRRGGPKSRCLFKTCRFESCSGHQFAGVAETQDAGYPARREESRIF
jgi:hypothetical protein